MYSHFSFLSSQWVFSLYELLIFSYLLNPAIFSISVFSIPLSFSPLFLLFSSPGPFFFSFFFYFFHSWWFASLVFHVNSLLANPILPNSTCTCITIQYLHLANHQTFTFTRISLSSGVRDRNWLLPILGI